MKINEASKKLNTLLSQTDKKREKRIYTCFINTLSSLEKREFTQVQLNLIQEKLGSFNLESSVKNQKRFIHKKHTQFKDFLKKEFSLTKEKHYAELGMIIGMSIGTGFGLSIGSAINPGIGSSTGLSMGTGIGLAIGVLIGSRKDAEAKRLGNVI